MPGRVSSSHFVGRRGELAELAQASREASRGSPRLVLLGGDSGVGKTRLLAEFERGLPDLEPALADAEILRGECLEQGDGELPYAPLLGALRPLARRRHPALVELSAGSRALLGGLLPSLGEPAAEPAPDRPAEPTGQVRLFEALLDLLDALSERSPVVLIFEDMHWADRSTRAFTSFLARSLRRERLILILTYRSDELHRRHPVRPLLAELDRLDCARRIDLLPFTGPELAEALTDILGAPAEPQLVTRLLARSEGNPLYLEELLAAGLDGRGAAPQSLRDAFITRIERLSPEARVVTRAVAVGVRLDDATLAEVTAIPRERLLEALREALAEQVLVTGEDDRFRLRHALLRETLYDDLLPGERVELHLALARAIERQCGESAEEELGRVATLAAHYAAGGDQAAALRTTVRAAGAAQRVHAWGEVAEAAERALELWPRVGAPERPADLDQVDLLVLAGRAHGLVGDRPRAEQLLLRALEELAPGEEPARRGAILGRLARIQWSLNRPREALATAERAKELLGDDRRSVYVLAWLARTLVLRGRYRDAIPAGEEALAAAVAVGEHRVEGEVLATLGMAHIALGDVARGEEELRRAIALAQEHDDLDGVTTSYSNLSDCLSLVGRTADALAVAREGLSVTPRRLSRSYDWMMLSVAMAAFDAGEWETARRHLRRPLSQALGVMLMFRRLSEAELALGEGEHAVAGDRLESAEPLVHDSSEPQYHGVFGSLRAELLRRQGDLDGARRAVSRALDELEVCTDDVMRIARVTAVGLTVEADRALRARDLREPADARDAGARARIHLQRLRAAAQDGGPVERAWYEVGSAEMSRARGRNDPGRWAKAAAAWRALERPYPQATALWREAEALVEAGERAAAARRAGEALAIARGLGAGWLAGEVDALIARARLHGADHPADETGSPAAVDDEPDPFGLTPRERQVLSLVAAGATNRQIGAALYMAEKTASVHVSRILGKLGVQTRTQAAAVAHRMHLA